MGVRQVALNRATKDGRRWQFYTFVNSREGIKKRYYSKLFFTKRDAEIAEMEFVVGVKNNEVNVTDMTLGDLMDEFYEYKKDKVKNATLNDYKWIRPKVAMLEPIKVSEFEINHFLKWRSYISSLDLQIKTKNGYYKYLKAILNYGTRWHDFNFTKVYNRMEKFCDPNALPREMDYYTLEEFQQYISVEEDIKWKSLFETLYFCGLRRGELRGLTWDNIDFSRNTLTVNKNCVNTKGDAGFWHLTTPKTRTSNRTIPMPNLLIGDLKTYKEEMMKEEGFNEGWFVFGNTTPLHPHSLRLKKEEIAKKAGLRVIRTHDFRHSCASLLINNGANIMIVAKYLGHTKIDETLNTYSHLFQSKLDDAVNTINELINEKF